MEGSAVIKQYVEYNENLEKNIAGDAGRRVVPLNQKI